ncbi:hypothetical protein C1645_741874 [Glomus cerebriforme]|uniref:Uncharacterized protein n=1 Tax=Glomus cerebriforme TaxID=658196 RepID=A0A397SQC3_9GLOM|nr:hypothetical protein C1645_741874 [Glomus cerebriforme]
MNPQKCCCCIPLKIGVVIISLLWLVYGFFCLMSGIYIGSIFRAIQPNAVGGSRDFSIVVAFIGGSLIIGAAFGLFVLIFILYCTNRISAYARERRAKDARRAQTHYL